MIRQTPAWKKFLGMSFSIAALIVSSLVFDTCLVSEAEARIGRPMSPNSIAGVSRRTARRTIRRSTVYVNSLPRSCTTVIIDDVSLHHCGTTYYQRHSNRYVVVYIN